MKHKTETMIHFLFNLLMVVFWLRFSYLGILLTKVIQVEQASTLLTTQNLFMIHVVNLFLMHQGTLWKFVLNCLQYIPLGTVFLAIMAMNLKEKAFSRYNRWQAFLSVFVQICFLVGLAYMMNNFSTIAVAISSAHTIGMISCLVGLVFTAMTVYTLVRIVVNREVLEND